MAKLYRNLDGGQFYDAFGGKIGEVEEIWAGDSFNRGVMDCYCVTAAKGSDSHAEGVSSINVGKNATFTAADCAINSKALGEIAYGTTKAGTVELCVDGIRFNSETETLQEKLARMQEQIDALKKKLPSTIGLRNELKTLKYEREVE